MKLLDDYLALQAAVFAYFGYVEDWRVIPIDDPRTMFWYLTNGEGYDSEVRYSPDATFPESTTYSDTIYTQRFLPRWVYRGPEFTMICVDTNTDGNKFLVGHQTGAADLALWARVDPTAQLVPRRFIIRGTGHPADMTIDATFLGTVLMDVGGAPLVWHVFEAAP